ncbi:HAD-IA family hydrolase [Phytohabitans houttuyneae]|uniref:Haloacid dehalogenase n=1 Tax=Phytohabitans houttuyneae TaxID=1076126 RepID=A0A6V8KBI6_9ACTN|nr:HAD-IA family hydrolase [Phytohabitans houttuyneae]GFJ78145.1 haloacid dehalogenase [Phytohabitans houttuyneae]
MVRARPTALLVDLDGVLRRWDPEVPARIEAAHGLPAGALEKTAMDWSRLLPAITGQVSHAGWMAGVAQALEAPQAVAQWQEYRGEVDPDVLGFVREVRAAGLPVAIGTNATDHLDADLAALGLTGEVDAVVNSSVVGAHKPTREFFAAACEALHRIPSQVLLVDDSDRFVRGARVVGLSAYRWNGPADLPYLRAALGLA